MYYVYLLRCGDDSLYTGITTDPARRLAEHRSAGNRGAKYTAAFGAKTFEALFSAPDRSSASKLEYRLKQLTRAQKQAIVENNEQLEDSGDCVRLPLDKQCPPQDNLPGFRLIRSSRRTLSAEIEKGGTLLVRIPYSCTEAELHAFLCAHRSWLKEHIAAAVLRDRNHPEPDAQQSESLICRANEELPERVAFYSRKMGLTPASIKVTGAKKRFGSCSAQNRLCFSWRLMQYPAEAVDYVVVHELAHIVHKNHSRQFYDLVASVLPDWCERRALLKQ